MKSLRRIIPICWLIGCDETFNDSGYSVCSCGRHSYYDYYDYKFGLINKIKYVLKEFKSNLVFRFHNFFGIFILCTWCHKPEYFLKKKIGNHEDCLPF